MKSFDYQKLDRTVEKIENFIGGWMFFIMMFFTGINVLLMYTVGKRTAGLDEIVLGAYVWVTYIAIGRHYKDHSCVSVDFLVKFLPAKISRVINILRDIISVIISAVMLYYGFKLTVSSVDKLTNILKISYTYFDAALVIGFGSIIIYIISKYVPRKKEPAAENKAEGGQEA